MMNIFVGNLSSHTTDRELQQLFEPFGKVTSARMVKDKFTHRPRGFGFVNMEERTPGEKAVEELNKKMVHRQSIVVREATLTESRNID